MGLHTWKADGTPVITPLGEGGVFVQEVYRPVGDSITITYPQLNGLQLRVYQVLAGSYTWATGTDGSGNPTLTLTALPATLNGGAIRLLVFAI